MNKQIKISIMIITYNRKNELLRALQSCVKNRIEDMEVVIVDNNSVDGTQEEVEGYLLKNNIKYKYYYSDNNLGISSGRNKAFELCEGEYIFCLDDDAIVITDDFFKKLYQNMCQTEAVAASVQIYEPASNRQLKGYIYEKNGQLRALSYIGAAHILRTSFFQGAKLYPDSLVFGSEEYYVAYRIQKYKKTLLHFEDLIVYHMPSKVARVYGDDRKASIIANNYIVRKMCYPIIACPFLYFFLQMRIVKHGFHRNEYRRFINEMIKTRYSEEFVDRMGLAAFVEMIRNVGVSQVF